MVDLAGLDVRIVLAPMAGGVSTPGLVKAVGEAGGLGFLAGGYLRPDALREQIAAVRAAGGGRPFGVNLFVPGEAGDPGGLAEYRSELLRYGAELPKAPGYDRDWWEEKVRLLVEQPVPVVSFTFGVPAAEDMAALRAVGSVLVVTVTSVEEAEAAVTAGAEVLCVQGPEAGAHRGTHRVTDEPGEVPLMELLAAVGRRVPVPLIAAGGLATGADIARVLDAGAVAAQLGTAYLRAPEAGTAQTHKDALVDPRYETTVVTRAFTGRPARALRTAFIEEHGERAPKAYPQVHHLTAPLRAAARQRGEAGRMSLWAGTGHRHARAEPAAVITRALWAEAGR
jgi:nitronate monooxygenase